MREVKRRAEQGKGSATRVKETKIETEEEIYRATEHTYKRTGL